jgi:hypothetical protein
MVRSSSTASKLDRDRRARTLALAVLVATSLLACTAEAATTAHQRVAHTARTLDGTATAHLHLIKIDGSQLIERGPATGALAGTATATIHTGALLTGTFTIYTHDGSITGHGTATPHGNGRYQSFAGTFLATSGTGRYTDVKGQGGLYGTYDRRSDEVVIQTTGTLTY